jgi:5-methylcytosine-specific restriction protein A
MIEHQPRRYRDKRRHAVGRFYDAAWAASAREFKRQHPFCLGCAAVGQRMPTTIVDHIVPHRGDRAKFNDPNNRQPACEWHHNAIKPILEGQYERGEVGIPALNLNSPEAVSLTKSKRRTAIGADGWLT